ncbi:MAG TPA: hypothetical protein VIK79_07540 [Xanthobacteraceae bacterium]|jgi:hypothetical protein
MKLKVILACVVVASLASPAFAATYYVVQNNKTHKCAVTTKKPSEKSKTSVIVGTTTGYPSKQEATTAMGGLQECKAA